MMIRLAPRLFVALVAVVLVAVGTISVFVTRLAEEEFREYEAASERLQTTRMAQWLIGYFERDSAWDGVQPYAEEMDALSGLAVAVIDADNAVVADSRGAVLAGRIPSDWSRHQLRSRAGSYLGTLYVSGERTIQEQFRTRLQNSLWLLLLSGSGLGLLAALLVSFLVARMIASPIREIAEFAGRAGRGDFSHRVSIRRKDELGELGAAFNSMAEELEETLQQRRNQVADTAHELRSPLTNIRGYLEAMEDEVLEVGESLPVLREEVDLLTRLVDDLQDLALAESGMLQISLREEHIGTLVEHAVSAHRFMAVQRNIELLVHLPDHLPPVPADAQRISQVLSNILRNAFHHTPEGGVVRVDVRSVDEFVEVAVCDSGSGIPPEELERVFERFRRLDPSRSRATGGSGLGLTIARLLVELHGGTIRAETNPGGGSCFVLDLPSGR